MKDLKNACFPWKVNADVESHPLIAGMWGMRRKKSSLIVHNIMNWNIICFAPFNSFI